MQFEIVSIKFNLTREKNECKMKIKKTHTDCNLFTGAIFEQGTDEVQSAFKFAMLNHNLNVTGRRFELQAYVDLISTADAFKLSRLSEYHWWHNSLLSLLLL